MGIVKLKRLAADYVSYLENESTHFQTSLEYTTQTQCTTSPHIAPQQTLII